VRACEAAGIASPTRLGVDGTQIQANAATVSLEEIPPTLSLTSANDAAVSAPVPETDTQAAEVTGLMLEVCTEGEAASDTPAQCPDRPSLRIDARTDDEPGVEPEPHVDEECELQSEAGAVGEPDSG